MENKQDDSDQCGLEMAFQISERVFLKVLGFSRLSRLIVTLGGRRGLLTSAAFAFFLALARLGVQRLVSLQSV